MVDARSPYLPSERWDELLSPTIRPPRLRLVPYRGELWLEEETTRQLVNVGNRHLLALGIWTVNARGSSYYAPMVKAADIPLGTRVQLVREPENVNDANAVAIMAGDLMLGYWNKQMARKLAHELDEGVELEAIILSGSPSGKSADRVRVLAAAPDLVAHLEGRTERSTPERPSLLRRLLGRAR